MQSTPLTHDLKSLEALYYLRGSAEIAVFLEKYGFLIPILLEAYPQIQAHFPDAVCALEVFVDPDSPGHQDLLLTISTTLDVDQAFATLKQFDKAWWVANMDRAQGYLIIDIEFQPHEL